MYKYTASRKNITDYECVHCIKNVFLFLIMSITCYIMNNSCFLLEFVISVQLLTIATTLIVDDVILFSQYIYKNVLYFLAIK